MGEVRLTLLPAVASLLGAVSALASCSDSTPSIDARKTIDAKAVDAQPIDAAPVVDASRITCFTNYDCPASEKCLQFDC